MCGPRISPSTCTSTLPARLRAENDSVVDKIHYRIDGALWEVEPPELRCEYRGCEAQLFPIREHHQHGNGQVAHTWEGRPCGHRYFLVQGIAPGHYNRAKA
jgi:hypothetical protein